MPGLRPAPELAPPEVAKFVESWGGLARLIPASPASSTVRLAAVGVFAGNGVSLAPP